MRSVLSTTRLRTCALTTLTVVAASCAGMRHSTRSTGSEACNVAVHNRTPQPLEIRLRVRAQATAPLGSLNPGELMTHSVPCAERRVWVAGIELPRQAGARPRFGVVYGEAELVRGERVQVALHWP